MDLTGKRVFLTGGARGIGRGIAEALLAKKARVSFCDIDEATGRATETALQTAYGAGNVTFTKCDVTDADEMKEAFEAAVSRFGAVDIFVNNAGIMNEALWEKMIELNMKGYIRGSQLALEHMRRDKGGRGGLIINVASNCGMMPFRWMPVYVATKHAIIGFTTSWARHPKMKEWGVRWRCFCPSGTETSLAHAEKGTLVDTDDYLQNCTQNLMSVSEVAQDFIRVVQDEDVNDVIFLVERDGKSRYVRRQLVDSDGVSNAVTVDNA